MHRHSTHTASTPSYRRNANKSGGNILPVLQVATCGSILAICPTRPETPCAEGTSHAWLSLRDLSRAALGAGGRIRQFRNLEVTAMHMIDFWIVRKGEDAWKVAPEVGDAILRHPDNGKCLFCGDGHHIVA